MYSERAACVGAVVLHQCRSVKPALTAASGLRSSRGGAITPPGARLHLCLYRCAQPYFPPERFSVLRAAALGVCVCMVAVRAGSCVSVTTKRAHGAVRAAHMLCNSCTSSRVQLVCFVVLVQMHNCCESRSCALQQMHVAVLCTCLTCTTCNACAERRTPNAGFRLPTDIEAEQSQQAAWDAGCRYWDTSPW